MNQHFKGGNLAGETINLMQDLLRWQPEIEKALRNLNHMYSFNDVVMMIVQGHKQFYSYDDCFVIMELSEFPGYKTYHCFLGGGKLSSITSVAEPQMMEIGETLGCKYISFSGRPAFERALKGQGWESKLLIMYKEI